MVVSCLIYFIRIFVLLSLKPKGHWAYCFWPKSGLFYAVSQHHSPSQTWSPNTGPILHRLSSTRPFRRAMLHSTMPACAHMRVFPSQRPCSAAPCPAHTRSPGLSLAFSFSRFSCSVHVRPLHQTHQLASTPVRANMPAPVTSSLLPREGRHSSSPCMLGPD